MIELGRITLSNPFMLAPLAGYTDLPFRRLCREKGAAMGCTELISIEGIVRNHDKTWELMRIGDDERPVAIQLFGKDVDQFSRAAQLTERLGPDCIDINMGCCAKKVCGPGSGAGLLRDTALLGRIASAVVRAVSIPVSAKIRIGYSEQTKNYREVVRILEDAGVNHIAVHGRTASQQYSGKADWNIISEVVAMTALPVIGSGDIASLDEARRRLAESGCRAVMIGRAAMGNPWIFSGEQPTPQEQAEMAIRHLNMMMEHYGDYGLVLARKHIVRYLHGFRNAAHERGAIATSTSPEWVIDRLRRLAVEAHN
jgi:tRNA-dihydrouridine synthase B